MNNSSSNSLALLLILSSTCLGEDTPFEVHPEGPIRSRVAVSLGTPSGINVCGSFWGKNVLGFRMTVGYLPGAEGSHAAGGQLEMVFGLLRRQNTILDCSLGGGISDINISLAEHQWTYGGAFASINTEGFFAQLGLTFGHDNYSGPGITGQDEITNPQLFFQIGLSLYTARDRL